MRLSLPSLPRLFLAFASLSLLCAATSPISADDWPQWLGPQRDFKKDFGLKIPVWGVSANPLLDGQKLICVVGGEGTVAVAFDKDTGKELWRALSAKESGYCPPTILAHHRDAGFLLQQPRDGFDLLAVAALNDGSCSSALRLS